MKSYKGSVSGGSVSATVSISAMGAVVSGGAMLSVSDETVLLSHEINNAKHTRRINTMPYFLNSSPSFTDFSTKFLIILPYNERNVNRNICIS